jgi:formylglycine-generating enzyme required for sulfatase activity
MVRVPAGEFRMGSDDPTTPAVERPEHLVKISQAFFLGRYEVTQAQFREVMGVNPSSFGPDGRHRNKVAGIDTGNYPVDSVSWLEAVRFCNRLSERHGLPAFYRIEEASVAVQGGPGYRLPTEAEWEYACRAGSRTRWHFGDSESDLQDFAWTSANSGATTHPVGQKKPNAWGLYDMYGNVPEWCWDRFEEDWFRRSPTIDPAGSGRGSTRVHRGGGWNDADPQTRSAARESLGGAYGKFTTLVGLRVARNAEP